MVKTDNKEVAPCAAFFVYKDDEDHIFAGLQRVQVAVPGWKPRYFMVDDAERGVSVMHRACLCLCLCDSCA